MDRMSRKTGFVAFFAIVIALLLALAACAPTEQAPTEQAPSTDNTASVAATATTETCASMNIVGLKGPTGIGMAKMMDDASGQADTPFHFNLVSAPEEAVSSIINKECDIALVPTNLAATLYARTNGGVKMIAINCLGNLYIVQGGEKTVTSLEDLRGQTIYATGKGANPQYILEHLLTQAGLTPGQDVTIEYLSEHAELATLVASGQRTLAMLPEPFVATAVAKNPDVSIAVDLNKAWEQSNSGAMTMGCAIVRTEYLEEHPEAITTFLEALQQSIDYCSQDVPGTAKLCVTYGIIADEAIAEAAIPNCAITYIAGTDMQPAITDFFTVLYDANPASLGGAIPDEAFYYVG